MVRATARGSAPAGLRTAMARAMAPAPAAPVAGCPAASGPGPGAASPTRPAARARVRRSPRPPDGPGDHEGHARRPAGPTAGRYPAPAGGRPPRARIAALAVHDGDEFAAVHVKPNRCAGAPGILRRSQQGWWHGVHRHRIVKLYARRRGDLLEQLHAALQLGLAGLCLRDLVLQPPHAPTVPFLPHDIYRPPHGPRLTGPDGAAPAARRPRGLEGHRVPP